MSSATSSLIVEKDVTEVDITQLFERILCTVHSPEDLKESFAFSLATVPKVSLDSSDLIRKTK